MVFGSGLARRRVLTCDEQSFAYHMRLEGFGLAELRTKLLEHIFEQERNNFGQADGLLLFIREPSNGLAGNKRYAILRRDVLQHCRGVANERDRLPVGERLLD